MMQRYRLRQLAQLPGESATHFLASLAELASLCKFGDLQDEMIHDQIIEKTSIPRIRERLLTRCARHSTAAAKPATKSSVGQTKTVVHRHTTSTVKIAQHVAPSAGRTGK